VARAPAGKQRRPGGGRKAITVKDPAAVVVLERLVEPTTRGDPESPLRWTCKSVRKLAAELCAQGHPVGPDWVRRTLRRLEYSLQGNRKTREGGDHPDRDAQFAHINAQATTYLAAGDPVISVDAKKKELVGDFKNGGRAWQPKGEREEVRVYDFPIKELGRVTPYGVYDLAANDGWVSVGLDHDTGAFAVATIRRWWEHVGRPRYPQATRLLITADGGGSNGSRLRLWKHELQQLAAETGLTITVCHYPPGTSKWNKIEHRLFAFLTQNWRGRPLVSYAVILNLIASTTTTTGLSVQSYLDTDPYPTGISVSDAEMDALHIARDVFHPDWNYTIRPRAA
jgi:transposase